MKFLSDLIKEIELAEAVQIPINKPKTGLVGVIAILDRYGVLDYEAGYAFNIAADAKRMEKFLEQTLEEDKVITDVCADGTYIVLVLSKDINSTDAEFLCFAKTEDEAQELIQELIENQKLNNITDDDLEDLDFIRTQD